MTTTANSTPTGFPKFDTNAISSSVPTNTVQSPVMSPAPYSPQAPVTQPVAQPVVTTPTVDVANIYNPTNGTTTQKQADATYTDKILGAVSSTSSVPSTDITSGNTFTTAGAKRSANEVMLQQYLDQQKAFQDKYLSAITPTAEETALQKRVNELKTQAGLNQEQALNSGETSSFAGGEAQRVARTDALKLAGAAEALQALQGQRDNTLKQLQYLQSTNDGSFKTQLEIQKLKNEVSGIDKQAQDTFFNLAQTNPDIAVSYDATKTPLENLSTLRAEIGKTKESTKFGTPQQLTDNERSLLTSFRSEPQVKNYAEILTKANAVNAVLDKKLGGPGDLAIVYEFMRALDPTSVVRETEYATAAKSGNIFAGIYTKFNGYLKPEGGFLPENVKKSFQSIVDTKLKQQQSIYDQIKGDYQSIAERSGLNPENVVINYDKTQRYTPSTSGAQATNTVSLKRDDGKTSSFVFENGKWVVK